MKLVSNATSVGYHLWINPLAPGLKKCTVLAVMMLLSPPDVMDAVTSSEQEPRKWSIRVVSGTRSASVVSCVKILLEPKVLFLGKATSTAQFAMRRSSLLVVSSAIRSLLAVESLTGMTPGTESASAVQTATRALRDNVLPHVMTTLIALNVLESFLLRDAFLAIDLSQELVEPDSSRSKTATGTMSASSVQCATFPWWEKASSLTAQISCAQNAPSKS